MYAFVGKCEGYTQIKVSVNNFFYLYFYLPCVCVAFPHCNPLRCLRPTWTTMWYDCDWNSKWMWHIRPIATTTRTTSTTRCCCRPDWCPDRCWWSVPWLTTDGANVANRTGSSAPVRHCTRSSDRHRCASETVRRLVSTMGDAYGTRCTKDKEKLSVR